MKKILGLSVGALVCWAVMFLAGHDAWHYLGSPDFWRLSGPPHTDMRAFGYAFYLQFLILLGVIGMAVGLELRRRRAERKAL
ncbi:MAG: hypothetical protein JW793_10290 [Acidobacteria bacterium]|nr:hypothetical protein [Acidobacteriota bacterium]